MDGEAFGKDAAKDLGTKDRGAAMSDLGAQDLDKHGKIAAQEFLHAVSSGDAAGLWQAFQAMDALCEEETGSGDDEPDDEPDEDPDDEA